MSWIIYNSTTYKWYTGSGWTHSYKEAKKYAEGPAKAKARELEDQGGGTVVCLEVNDENTNS